MADLVHQESTKLDLLRKGMREKEAADYLGLSVKTLQAWRFEGRGPAYCRLGKAIVYWPSELDEFREKRTIRPVRGGAQ